MEPLTNNNVNLQGPLRIVFVVTSMLTAYGGLHRSLQPTVDYIDAYTTAYGYLHRSLQPTVDYIDACSLWLFTSILTACG